MESGTHRSPNGIETLSCDFHEQFVQKFHNPVFVKSGLPHVNGETVLFSELSNCKDGCEILERLGHKDRCTCPAHNQRFQILDKQTGKPQGNVPYRLNGKSGIFIDGMTDEEGLTKKIHSHLPEEIEITLFNRPSSKAIRANTTPKNDKEPFKVYLKVFWEIDREWTEADIAAYCHEAQGIAGTIQQTTEHTCDKFALSVLIEFASLHKLPLKIKTGAGIFHNIEPLEGLAKFDSSPDGYREWAVPHFAAQDMPSNTVVLKSRDELLAGDILLRFDHKHVQVVMWANATTIHIKQGNFPNRHTVTGFLTGGVDKVVGKTFSVATGTQNKDSVPGSLLYLGVHIQDGTYIKESTGCWSFQNTTLKQPRNHQTFYEMPHSLRWDFYGFNK